MKFTEKQFKKLVEIQEKYFPANISTMGAGGLSLNRAIYESNFELGIFIAANDLDNEVVALMNPLTREWAHEQYVEKEKRYVWYLKNNNFYRLTNHGGATQVNISHSSESSFTESEIREWGFDPERFDKEEVE